MVKEILADKEVSPSIRNKAAEDILHLNEIDQPKSMAIQINAR
jgi:hypothetical protein